MLFDENPVSIGIRPKLHKESTFEYYNRSSRTDIRPIRQLIEGWFARIPQLAQQDLRQRFRSREDTQHRAALFELFLHELFTRMGFSLEFHPQISGARRPDFLVRRGNADLFYLEATTAGASVEEVGAQRRISQVYDSINSLKNTDFYLAVFVKGAPETPPRGSRLRRDLERWLRTLDWQAIRENWEAGGFDAVPSYLWQHDGWDVKFQPLPKSGESRGEPSVRPIGLTMPLQMQRVAPEEGVKKAIEAKNEYHVTKPLLVAVNLMQDFCQAYDVMNALFGHETVVFTENGTKPGARLHDGAWDGPQGPQNKSISAAMIFQDLQVWNIKHEKLWIVHNPWSTRPLDATLLPFGQYVPNKEKDALQLVAGSKTVGEILGLPDPWPPEEEDLEQAIFGMLSKALGRLADRISIAFVYGSMAREEDRDLSDIDLMMIGEATLEDVVAQMDEVERLGSRPVNPTVYSAAEFKTKLENGNHFLASVLRREKIFLIGGEDELRTMAGEPLAHSGTDKSGRN